MNIGSMQVLLGSAQRPASPVGNIAVENKFGTSFREMLISGSPAESLLAEEMPSDISIEQTIMALFNSTTLEEIGELIGDEQMVTDPAGLWEMDMDKLMDKIEPLLEQSGFDDEDMSSNSQLWALLNFVDDVAPKFFAGLADALEGKGVIPRESALDLLAVLKAVAIAAPQTDLLLKQEQQVFSLQSYLATTGERIEKTTQENGHHNGVPKFLEFHRAVVKIVQPMEAKQQAMNEEGPKESIQSALQHLSGIRSGQPLMEVESKPEARNEFLLREMQAIFKRSNFGQVGGTNRLLIKLYPEHLGQVRIELLHTNGVLTARMLASTALGKEMLDSQLNQLRAAFLQQNIQVDRIDVAQMLQDTPRGEKDQQAFQQHSGNGEEQPEEQQEQQEEMTFQQYMIELEV